MNYNFTAAVDEVIAIYPFGKASAAKRGRNSLFPYVPIVDHDPSGNLAGTRKRQTEQILGSAFADRDKAVACAAAVIEARRSTMRKRFFEPRYRAFREQWGLPRELPVAP